MYVYECTVYAMLGEMMCVHSMMLLMWCVVKCWTLVDLVLETPESCCYSKEQRHARVCDWLFIYRTSYLVKQKQSISGVWIYRRSHRRVCIKKVKTVTWDTPGTWGKEGFFYVSLWQQKNLIDIEKSAVSFVNWRLCCWLLIGLNKEFDDIMLGFWLLTELVITVD